MAGAVDTGAGVCPSSSYDSGAGVCPPPVRSIATTNVFESIAAANSPSLAASFATSAATAPPPMHSPCRASDAGGGATAEGMAPAYLSGGGIVRVLLKRGHNLAPVDWTGTSDPYVVAKLGTSHRKSKRVDRNVNPEWNESLDFDTAELWTLLQLPLKLQVLDHNFLRRDADLGSVEVDLLPLLRSCPKALPQPRQAGTHVEEHIYDGLYRDYERVELQYANGGRQGQVSLRVAIVPAALRVSNLGEHKTLDAARQALASLVRSRHHHDGAVIRFDGAGDESLEDVSQAWSIEHSDRAVAAANHDALRAVADFMQQAPGLSCRVHCETDSVSRGPARLASKLRLSATTDVDELMSHLARQRATACVEGLVRLGVAPTRLRATHKGQGGGSLVAFALELGPTPSDPRPIDHPPPEGPAGHAGGTASAGATISPSRTGLLRTRGDQIGIGVNELELSAAIAEEPRFAELWVAIDLPGLLEERELTTSRMANPSNRARHQRHGGSMQSQAQLTKLDFDFYHALDVPPRSAAQKALGLALDAAAPSSASASISFTLWAVDPTASHVDEVGSATLSLPRLLQSGQDTRDTRLQLRGRRGAVATLCVSVHALDALRDALAAHQAHRPADLAARGSGGDATAAAAPSPGPRGPLDAVQVLEWAPRQAQALSVLQRYTRKRHNQRVRSLHRRSRQAARQAALAHAQFGSREVRAGEPPDGVLATLGQEAAARVRLEALMQPPPPVQRRLDAQGKAVVRLQAATRAALGRRAARTVRRKSALGGMMAMGSEWTSGRTFGAASERTFGGGGSVISGGAGRGLDASALLNRAHAVEERATSWRAWLAEERRRIVAQALLDAKVEKQADVLVETSPVTLRMHIELPTLPLAAAYRRDRLEKERATPRPTRPPFPSP